MPGNKTTCHTLKKAGLSVTVKKGGPRQLPPCFTQYPPLRKTNKNKFFPCWNNHCLLSNEVNVNDDNDQAVLFKHFYRFFFDNLNAKPDITKCFMAILVEQLYKTLLNWCENKCINYLNGKNNINIIFLSYNCDLVLKSLFFKLHTHCEETIAAYLMFSISALDLSRSLCFLAFFKLANKFSNTTTSIH